MKPGTKLGPYQITDQLGKGGMGEATSGIPVIGPPEELFPIPPLGSTDSNTYAVTPDGERFLVAVTRDEQLPISVVLNWESLR